MRIFQLKACARMTRRAAIPDAALVEAVARAARGIVDADLGGCLYKQRIARPGQGRSGGFRMLLAMDETTRAVFLFGFAKSDQANISSRELQAAKVLGAAWLEAPDGVIERALADRELVEVDDASLQQTVPPLA